MKYIITEEQLEDVVQKYIEFLIEPLKTVKTKRGELRWVDEDGLIQIEIEEYSSIILSFDFVKSIKDMFGLDYDSVIWEVKKFFQKKYNINVHYITQRSYQYSMVWKND